MSYIESHTEHTRHGTIYIVAAHGDIHTYKSITAANADFPGAFDVPDQEEEEEVQS